MPFDALVANPGRLKILTALAVEERQEFVDLRRRTQLTDGNLAAHAKRLHTGGLIEIDKRFKDGKPVTAFVLTTEGRRALESHTRRLIAALSHRRRDASSSEPSGCSPAPLVSVEVGPDASSSLLTGDDEWVD